MQVCGRSASQIQSLMGPPWLGMQIQRRDIPGFVETKQQLLDLRPGNRNNWISFAVAHHLNDSHELAVQVLDAYDQTQVPSARSRPAQN